MRRLDPAAYRGLVTVHWTFTIAKRKQGWLDPALHCTVRELLTHLCFRFSMSCPAYCLMPDHMHLLFSGTSQKSDQRLAVRWLRRHFNRLLREKGFALQKQGYDYVLRQRDRNPRAFEKIASYIFANPERAGLTADGSGLSRWPFLGAVVPGYPELHPKDIEFWDSYWKLHHRAIEELR